MILLPLAAFENMSSCSFSSVSRIFMNMTYMYVRQRKNLVKTAGFSDVSILSCSVFTVNYKMIWCSLLAVSAFCLLEKINANMFVYIYFCHAIIQDVFLENFTSSLCH